MSEKENPWLHEIGNRPPKKLSAAAKRTLDSAEPAHAALGRAAAAVKLEFVDGRRIGL